MACGNYMLLFCENVVHKSLYDARFTDVLVPQKYNFVFDPGCAVDLARHS